MATKKNRRRKSTRGEKWPWQIWAIFAGSGVGKTTLAATAPKPFFLDSNQGLMSVEGRVPFGRTTIRRWKDLDRAYNNFTGTGKKDWSGYQTVVFDHFDDIQGLVLDDLAEQAAERDERRNPDEYAQREWGIMGNRLRRYLRKFKRLPMHKILIFAAMEDRITGQARPHLAGSLKDDLPYFCDHIAYMRVGKGGRRYIHLDQTDRFWAKTRAWWLLKEERKQRFDFDDLTMMTKLIELTSPSRRKQ